MKIIFTSIFIFLTTTVFAQVVNSEWITDRPDRTESASSVQVGSLQIESGFEYESDKSNVNTEISSLNIASTLLRYGLFEKFELRLGGNFLSSSIESGSLSLKRNGLSDIMLGAKYAFINDHSEIPDIALILHFFLPLGAEVFKPAKTEPQAILAAAKSLTENFDLGINLGTHYNSSAEELFYFYTVAAGIGISDKLGAFAEVYSEIFPNNPPFISAGAGFTYLILPNLQLDISGGNGLFNNSKVWYLGAGFSVRVPR